MTAPLPPWRVVHKGAVTSDIEVDLPDFGKMILVIANNHVGGAIMESVIRRALARRESDVDITSTGAPL